MGTEPDTLGSVRRPARALPRHTDEVLAGLGISEGEYARLGKDGVMH